MHLQELLNKDLENMNKLDERYRTGSNGWKYRTLPPRMKAFLEMIVNHEKNDLIMIKL